MARNDQARAERAPSFRTFRTMSEEAFIAHCEKVPSCLVFAPDATPESMAAALHARTERLNESLRLWSLLDSDQPHLTMTDVVLQLLPVAEEIDLIAHALADATRGQAPAD